MGIGNAGWCPQLRVVLAFISCFSCVSWLNLRDRRPESSNPCLGPIPVPTALIPGRSAPNPRVVPAPRSGGPMPVGIG